MAIQTSYTVEDYERLIALAEHADRRFELIQGEIVETMPTQEHGVIGLIVSGSLFNWWNAEGRRGWLMIETRFGLPEDKSTALIPDIAYISPERAEPLRKRGAVPYMPDLAVEILSPDDSLAKAREKLRYYMTHGTRLSWLLIADKRAVEVYTADGEVALLTAEADDALDGGAVLPGFRLALREVFVTSG